LAQGEWGREIQTGKFHHLFKRTLAHLKLLSNQARSIIVYLDWLGWLAQLNVLKSHSIAI